jgi:methylglutaconyl-CoA hydratase
MIQFDRPYHPNAVSIVMDRPEKRNALNAALVEGLIDALNESARDNSVRVVVLTGAGNTFSAGADLAALKALRSATHDENLADSRLLVRLFETVRRLPKPVIARINGHAIAGGCGLASICDFSIAHPSARLGFTEVRIGFVPAIVSVYLRPRLGETVLRDLLLTGRLLSAPEAHRIGLVTSVAGENSLDESVADLVHTIGRRCSADGIAGTKALLADLYDIDARLQRAAQRNADARMTPDCHRGIDAFLAKTDFPWTIDWDGDDT